MQKLSYNRKDTFTIFDFETTSLNLYFAKPWQLAYSHYKAGKCLETIERYPYFADLKVSKKAAQITGFSYEKYYDLATPAEEVAEEFAAIVYESDNFLVGHNILSFDLAIWKVLCRLTNRWRGWSFIDRAIDTLPLARAFNAEETVDMENFLGWQMKYVGKPPRGSKKATLSAMAKTFDIPVDESKLHDAAYDISLNYQVFDKLVKKLDI